MKKLCFSFQLFEFLHISKDRANLWWWINVQLTVSCGVAQHFGHLLVGGVLSQSTHDVSDLVVSHLVVSDSVEETKGLPVVCKGQNIALMEQTSSCKLKHVELFVKYFCSYRWVGGWGGCTYVTTGQVVVLWGWIGCGAPSPMVLFRSQLSPLSLPGLSKAVDSFKRPPWNW